MSHRGFVFRSNLQRRNLSPDQQRDIRGKKKLLAVQLCEAGHTQEEAAYMLSVAQQTLSDWLQGGTITGPGISSPPDHRVKVPGKEYQRVADRMRSGERLRAKGLSQRTIAAKLGVSQAQVSADLQAAASVAGDKCLSPATPPLIHGKDGKAGRWEGERRAGSGVALARRRP